MKTETKPKHTPGPWNAIDVGCAGLQIQAPVNLCTFVELPLGMPPVIFTFNMSKPAVVSIAHERWVQFEPKGWHEMQLANAQLIAASPAMYEALEFYATGQQDNGAFAKKVIALSQLSIERAEGEAAR